MATIDAIRTAIGVRLLTLAEVRVEQEWGGPFNVSGNAAVAIVEYAGTVYDSVMGGQGDAVMFKVTMLVPQDRVGRARLDAFCDPTRGSATSVREAVNGTLAGLVAFATVTTASEYQKYEISELQTYTGCEFLVSVAT